MNRTKKKSKERTLRKNRTIENRKEKKKWRTRDTYIRWPPFLFSFFFLLYPLMMMMMMERIVIHFANYHAQNDFSCLTHSSSFTLSLNVFFRGHFSCLLSLFLFGLTVCNKILTERWRLEGGCFSITTISPLICV